MNPWLPCAIHVIITAVGRCNNGGGTAINAAPPLQPYPNERRYETGYTGQLKTQSSGLDTCQISRCRRCCCCTARHHPADTDESSAAVDSSPRTAMQYVLDTAAAAAAATTTVMGETQQLNDPIRADIISTVRRLQLRFHIDFDSTAVRLLIKGH